MVEQIPSANQSVAAMVDTIHSIAASHEWLGTFIGKVISPPPNLKVAVNNIILEKQQLYIDVFLLRGYYRTSKGTLNSGTQPEGHHVHTHEIANPYTETFITTDTLKAGDYVTVLPLKGAQQFVILGRVVYLGETSSDPHNKN